MAQYSFGKHVGILQAFDKYIKDDFPSCNGIATTGNYDEVLVEFPEELAPSEYVSLSNTVANYTDPSYFLDFDHTDNLFMHTHMVSSATPTLLESFIISPYQTETMVLGDMKSIVQLNTDNVAHWASWNSNTEPVHVSISIYDYTDKKNLITTSLDLNSTVASEWVPLAQAGSNFLPPIAKTLHMYGLKDENPGSDCIWQFLGSITSSNAAFDLNGLQKIYYNIITST
jgi:hypothetical protein